MAVGACGLACDAPAPGEVTTADAPTGSETAPDDPAPGTGTAGDEDDPTTAPGGESTSAGDPEPPGADSEGASDSSDSSGPSDSGDSGEPGECARPWDPGLPEGSPARLERRSFEGPQTGLELEYNVYFPPGYDQSERDYPVLYHLHGVGGNPREDTLIEALEAAMQAEVIGPMVMIFPYSQPVRSYWLDSEESAVESWVIEDLIPHVEASYKVVADPQLRNVSGFSMGGFGAMLYGTKYPDHFASAVSYDGAVHIGDESTPFVHSTENRDRIVEGISLVAAVGDIVDANRSFQAHLEELDIPFTYYETDCGHSVHCISQERGMEIWGVIHAAMMACP